MVAEDARSAPEVLVTFEGSDLVTTSNDVTDYCLRSKDAEYDALSLWMFAAGTTKITSSSEEVRLARTAGSNPPDANGRIRNKRGKKAFHRGSFVTGHPQIDSHMLRARSPVVPVLLGPTLPWPDRGRSEYEKWCRAMMIIFRPWRIPADLKDPDMLWSDAFNQTVFPPAVVQIMRNMNVENECQDARDEHSRQRRAGETGSLLGRANVAGFGGDILSLGNALENDALLDRDSDDGLDDAEDPTPKDKDTARECELSTLLDRLGLWRRATAVAPELQENNLASSSSPADIAAMNAQAVLMGILKRDKRPSKRSAPEDVEEAGPAKRQRMLPPDLNPTMDLADLPDGTSFNLHNIEPRHVTRVEASAILEDIIVTMKIRGNPEQERAVRMVGEHFIAGTENQLLLYIAGVGGAGKSYVIHAIVQLFERCGYSDELLLSAPTGCAAVLIHGYTIHALTFLPQSDYKIKNQAEVLEQLWRSVRYLVIDEISMVSARLLSQICNRIMKARAWATKGREVSFGGVNVIYLGDLGQLKPVKAKSFFSHELVSHILPNTVMTMDGQSALIGAYLWRMVNNVVILRRNMRAANDPRFINLLGRIRVGEAWEARAAMTPTQKGTGANYTVADFATLQTRLYHRLSTEEQTKFANAPVIITTKVVRDVINLRMARQHSAASSQTLTTYKSIDRYKRQRVAPTLQQRLWKVRSKLTKDSLGELPLFIGMKIIVTENVAIKASVVNGAQGIVEQIKYEEDNQGNRFLKCVYISIEDAGVKSHGIDSEFIPIFPVTTSFAYKASDGVTYTISRQQVPLLPAYAFVDYKVQGRSMDLVNIDLQDCQTLQSAYVMLSRATSLHSLCILRPFSSSRIYRRMAQEFRDEFECLEKLHAATAKRWEARKDNTQEQF